MAALAPDPASQITGQTDVKVVRGRVDSLSLYEITDYELDILETGAPTPLYLNLAIFFLSVGCAFTIALFTANIEPARTHTVFVVLGSVGIAGGLLFLFLWLCTKSEVAGVVSRIKARIPEQQAIKKG